MPIVVNVQEKRARIFQAAIRVFARKGYHGATVDDLAAEAGVAKGTIYNYFKGKADLFTQLFEEVEGGICAGLEARQAGIVEPLERMRRCFAHWCEVFTGFGEDCPLILEIWSTSCCHPGEHEEVRQCLARSFARGFDDIERDLQTAIEVGTMRKDLDPRAGARAISAIFDGLLLQCLVERDLEAMRIRAPAALELLLRGFLASPGDDGSRERRP